MMKTYMRRGISLILAAVMVLALGISGVQAAPASKTVSFEKLSGIGTELFQGGAVIENKNEKVYADTDMVRVMIVLEDAPAVSELKGGEQFTTNIQAVNYRSELQAKQEKLADEIGRAAGRERGGR
jgi:hypothetical protein